MNQTYTLSMVPGGVPVRVECSQYDRTLRKLVFFLMGAGTPYQIPAGASAMVIGMKPAPDRKGFTYPAEVNGSSVIVTLTDQMTCVAGEVRCQISIATADGVEGSACFVLDVEASALPENADVSASEYASIAQAAAKAATSAKAAKDCEEKAEDARESAVTASEAATKAATTAQTAAQNAVASQTAAQSSAESAASSATAAGTAAAHAAEILADTSAAAQSASEAAAKAAQSAGVIDTVAIAVGNYSGNLDDLPANSVASATNGATGHPYSVTATKPPVIIAEVVTTGGDADNKIQTYTAKQLGNAVARRVCWAGSWGDWGWVIPPTSGLDGELRLANGHYLRRISMGQLPDHATTVQVDIGVTGDKVVSLTGIAHGASNNSAMGFPVIRADGIAARLYIANGAVAIATLQDMSSFTAEITVEYVK